MRSVLACLLLLCAAPALAAPWQVDMATSKLTFTAEQAGEKFQGAFPKFTAAIDFDPAAPEKGRIEVAVNMASVQVEGSDRAEALPGEEWLAVKQFPTATFTSTNIRADGGHPKDVEPPRYLAQGNLTLRGVSKPVTLPFALKTTGKNAVATGELTLSRSDFGIGQGRWAEDRWVAFPVVVRFTLHATQAR